MADLSRSYLLAALDELRDRGLDDAADHFARLVDGPVWIDVNKRLPMIHTSVLVSPVEGQVVFACLTSRDFDKEDKEDRFRPLWIDNEGYDIEVTHWAPRPNPVIRATGKTVARY